jgi:hypothetical protein
MVLTGQYADKKFAEYGYGWNENWNNYDNFYDEYLRQKGGASDGKAIPYIQGKIGGNTTNKATPAAPGAPAAPAVAPAAPATPAAPAAPVTPASAAKQPSGDLPPELMNPSKLHQKAAKVSSIEINGFKVALNDLASEDDDMDPELRSQDLTQMEEQGIDEAIESMPYN